MIDWNNVIYEASFGVSKQLSASAIPEVAFSGRSNVGKSSLINRLFNRKALARTSASPGKTVTVNFFRAGDVRFADLPGYGYAKLPKSEKARFAELMEHYFQSNRPIKLLVQLLDMRHPPSKDDVVMLDFLQSINMPFLIVLTKADKLNKSERAARLKAFDEELKPYSAEYIPFSAVSGEGVDEIKNKIEGFCHDNAI